MPDLKTATSVVHIIAGDDDGGDYVAMHVDVVGTLDDVSDALMQEARDQIREMFRRAHGSDPQAVVIYCEETADA